MKKFLLGSLVAVALVLSFAPTAKADSVVSISYNNRSGGHGYERHHYNKHRHSSRPAYYKHKRHHDGYRVVSHYVHRPFVTVRPAPIVYQSVIVRPSPAPVYIEPTPILANQTSPSYYINGQTCREYESDVVIGGHRQTTYGTACLQQDGAWRIVD